jgi:hypothetical protein
VTRGALVAAYGQDTPTYRERFATLCAVLGDHPQGVDKIIGPCELLNHQVLLLEDSAAGFDECPTPEVALPERGLILFEGGLRRHTICAIYLLDQQTHMDSHDWHCTPVTTP